MNRSEPPQYPGFHPSEVWTIPCSRRRGVEESSIPPRSTAPSVHSVHAASLTPSASSTSSATLTLSPHPSPSHPPPPPPSHSPSQHQHHHCPRGSRLRHFTYHDFPIIVGLWACFVAVGTVVFALSTNILEQYPREYLAALVLILSLYLVVWLVCRLVLWYREGGNLRCGGDWWKQCFGKCYGRKFGTQSPRVPEIELEPRRSHSSETIICDWPSEWNTQRDNGASGSGGDLEQGVKQRDPRTANEGSGGDRLLTIPAPPSSPPPPPPPPPEPLSERRIHPDYKKPLPKVPSQPSPTKANSTTDNNFTGSSSTTEPETGSTDSSPKAQEPSNRISTRVVATSSSSKSVSRSTTEEQSTTSPSPSAEPESSSGSRHSLNNESFIMPVLTESLTKMTYTRPLDDEETGHEEEISNPPVSDSSSLNSAKSGSTIFLSGSEDNLHTSSGQPSASDASDEAEHITHGDEDSFEAEGSRSSSEIEANDGDEDLERVSQNGEEFNDGKDGHSGVVSLASDDEEESTEDPPGSQASMTESNSNEIDEADEASRPTRALRLDLKRRERTTRRSRRMAFNNRLF